MFSKKHKRMDNAISAGSMADIAFLLLIFFLVTTTIVEDKGIMVKLPPYEQDATVNPPSKNVLSVKINGAGELMFEGEQLDITRLKTQVQDFIMNKTKRKDRPSSPNKAVVSLQNDRSTPYENYIEVYDILKSAYHGLWDTEGRRRYGSTFDNLGVKEQRAIKKKIPMVISEAEPSDFGKG